MVLRSLPYIIPSPWITGSALLGFQAVGSYRWIEELRTPEQRAFMNHYLFTQKNFRGLIHDKSITKKRICDS